MATDTLDRMAEICREAHVLIDAQGTPEMRATIRLLLIPIGRGLVRHEADPRGQREDR